MYCVTLRIRLHCFTLSMVLSLKSMARRRLENACAAAFSAIFVLCSTPALTASTASTAPCTSANLRRGWCRAPSREHYKCAHGNHDNVTSLISTGVTVGGVTPFLLQGLPISANDPVPHSKTPKKQRTPWR